jgi:hypothetical protein
MTTSVKLISTDQALAHLEMLEKASQVAVQGPWNAFQVLSHCAQSVEYSVSGYPQHRSTLFKATAGRIALRSFIKRGEMKHDLTAGVPGAEAPGPEGTLQQGIARLRSALEAFRSGKGELQPHFAYGPVSRADYDTIHALHLANHLTLFTVTP